MRIASRYFILRFLGLFVSILLGATLLIVVIEMLLHFDDMIKDPEGPIGILRTLFLRIPAYYLRDLLPITGFAATFLALALGARWREILGLKAGGIAPMRVVLPILAAAACLTILSFFLNESLVVEAAQERFRQNIDQEALVAVGWGDFWYKRGNTIYSVRDSDRANNTLRGIRLFERNARGRLVRSVEAETGRIVDSLHWEVEDATIRRFDPRREDEEPILERIDGTTTIELADPSGLALLSADPSVLSIPRLSAFIEAKERSGEPTGGLESLLHERLADPFTLLLFAALAAPLGLRVERDRGFARPALLGVIAIAAFFAARNVVSTLGANDLIPPFAGPWALLAVFAAFALVQLKRAPA